LAIRTATPAGLDGLASALRREVRALDADQAVFDVATMPERIATSLGLRRFALAALAFFAAIALALALVGIYGVLSFVVVESRREIGVRMALGAGTGRVVGGVLGRGMAPAAAGSAACSGGSSRPTSRRTPAPRRSSPWRPPSPAWSRRAAPPGSTRWRACASARQRRPPGRFGGRPGLG